jgi:hypothetical protein
VDTKHEVAPHGFVSLREYMDVQFSAVREAVAKSERQTELRFDAVNEFRAQLGDQTRTLVPRPEVEQKFKSIDEKLDTLATRLNARDDRGKGMGEIWGFIVGALGILSLVISYLRGLH